MSVLKVEGAKSRYGLGRQSQYIISHLFVACGGEFFYFYCLIIIPGFGV